MRKSVAIKMFMIALVLVLATKLELKAQVAQAPSLGNGDEATPYQIENLSNLYWLTQNSSVWDKYFIQTAQIDALDSKNWNDGKGFSPIGNNSTEFTGEYNGGGFTISNLYMNYPEERSFGMFKYVGTGGLITKLGLVQLDFYGNEQVSAFVGELNGSISQCFATGEISSLYGSNAGLVNSMYEGSISDCYAAVNLKGGEYNGGLVYSADEGTIARSYSIGQVPKTGDQGGLFGSYNYATLSNIFWNTELSMTNIASPEDSYEDVAGLTNTQMLAAANFTGFDFETVWQIDEGMSFPYLRNVIPAIKPGETPVLSIPAASSVAQQISPNFQWFGIIPTAEFDIQVSALSDFSVLVINESNLADTSYQTAISLSNKTTYYWRVRNVISSIYGVWSTVQHFETTGFTQGNGTLESPYEISTINQLNEVRFNPSVYYKLTQNIDALTATGTESGEFWNDGKGFEPIQDFAGDFNGNGFVISGLTINRLDSDSNIGLFSKIEKAGKIHHVGLIDLNFTSSEGTGGLAGSNFGTIISCFTTGKITAESYVGGLVGYNLGSIQKSYSSVTISGEENVGGLVGNNSSDYVYEGEDENEIFGEISESFATGSVFGKKYVGGLVGSSEGTIETSYSTNFVYGESIVGGLIGQSNAEVSQSYSSASVVSTNGNRGGFIANDYDYTTDSYWNVSVGGANDPNSEADSLNNTNMKNEASFTGFDFTSIWQINEGESFPYLRANIPTEFPGNAPELETPKSTQKNIPLLSFHKWKAYDDALSYELQVSSKNDFSTNEIALTDLVVTQVQSEESLAFGTNYFWRVRAITATDTSSWSSIGYFKTTLFENGDGTELNPYQIKTITELNSIRDGMDAYYELANDIDLSFATSNSGGELWNNGDGFIPIGYTGFVDAEKFNGSFDGSNFSISGLTMKLNNGNLALFSSIGEQGVVKNLGLDSVYIKNYSSAAPFAAYNYGTITNCYSSGKVEGRDNAAGFVIQNFGTISESSSSVNVNGVDYVGGFVSLNQEDASITKSFATGSVTGTYYIGGLVGQNSSSITKSYSTGELIGIKSSKGQIINRSAYTHGGLVGINYTNGVITDCYTSAKLGVGNEYGGIVGTNGGSVTTSYTFSTIEGYGERRGPIVGTNSGSGSVTNSYWNSDFYNHSNEIGTELTTQTMRSAASFTGFDFETVWQIDADFSFPYLRDVTTNSIPGELEMNVSGKSLSFSSGYISIPNQTIFDDLASLTLETWVYLDTTGRQGIIEKHKSPSSGFWVDYNNDITAVLVTVNGEVNVSSTINPTKNRWYHVAVTYNGTSLKLYLDGKDVSSVQTGAGSGMIKNNTNSINIGKLNWNAGSQFRGKMDEIRIWNEARSETEIQNSMYQNLNGDEDSLLVYLPFDEIDGTLLVDKTSNNNNVHFAEGVSRSSETHPYGVFITGSQGYRMMASPLQNVTFATLLDTLWTQGYPGADSEENNSNVYVWDEPNYEFVSISNASETPSAGKGFITLVYDDQNFDGIAEGFPKNLQFNETQQSGEITPTISFTDSETESAEGWNLVGNPYGTTINWNSDNGLTRQNLDDVIYIWSSTADNGNGAYLTWNGTTGSLGNGLIAPWQGFWIKANAASPSIILNDDIRSAGAVFNKKAITPKMNFTLSNGERSTSTYLMFNDQSSVEKDRFDAYKLESLSDSDFALFTSLPNGDAAEINALPLTFSESLEIPISMQGSILSGSFDLTWKIESIPDFITIQLKNNTTGELIDLTNQDKITLDFKEVISEKMAVTKQAELLSHKLVKPKVLKSSGESNATYSLVISSDNTVGIESDLLLPKNVELSQNFPNPFNPSTTIQFGLPATAQVSLTVFNVLGQRVAVLVNNEMIQAGSHSIAFNASNLASGMYLYRLQTGNSVLVKKLTLIK